MRLTGLSLLLALCSGEALAQACVVHSTAERLDVKVLDRKAEYVSAKRRASPILIEFSTERTPRPVANDVIKATDP